MYTKTGLGALAIAGLTLGAVGMLTSAGASPADCRAPSSGISAPATTGDNGNTSVSAPDDNAKNANKDANKDGTKKPSTTGTTPGTSPNQGADNSGGSAGSNGSNGSADSGDGSGTGGGSGNLLSIDGGTTSPDSNAPDTNVNVTVPNGSSPSAGSTSGDSSGTSKSTDRPFLDLLGRVHNVQTPAGTAPVPPTDASLIGRSWYIGSLLNITGRANAGS